MLSNRSLFARPSLWAAFASLALAPACTYVVSGDQEFVDEFAEFKATGGQCVGEVEPPDAESPLLEANSYGFLIYDGVLARTVTDAGNVRYGALLSTPELGEGARLTVKQLASVDPTRFSTHEEKLAFWINAYNGIVLEAAAKAYGEDPAFRVDQNNAAFFDQRVHVVGGRTFSLNEIEHGVMRGTQLHSSTGTLPDDEWQELLALHNDLWAGADFDVRFHFAINCASRSCPVLNPQAYRADTLDAVLEADTERFIFDDVRGANAEGISQIFDFYFDDFERVGGVESFISQYRDTSDLNLFRYLFYDWSLNIAQ